ncbi:MAG TPA: hypothetical protein VGZ90_13580 [Puia sp.]|jgi:hypothetical protein|nr:hypothetical protein [Puia sp.]
MNTENKHTLGTILGISQETTETEAMEILKEFMHFENLLYLLSERLEFPDHFLELMDKAKAAIAKAEGK